MNYFTKLLNNFLEYLNKFYILLHPENLPSVLSYKNLFKNIFWFYKKKQLIFVLNYIFKFFIKLFLDLFKLIYFPIVFVFYISNYRFIQIDYSQIGTFCHQIEIGVKHNSLKKKKSIIFIPKTHSRSVIKKIFKNLIIFDNIILNILAQPLIHNNLISSNITNAEYLYDEKNKKVGDFFPTQIVKLFKNNINFNQNIFQFKEKYFSEMYKYFNDRYTKFNLSNTIILHVRDNNFIASSNLRSGTLKNYIKTINFLIDSGYSVIRLTHDKSEKLKFNEQYYELNTNEKFNQYFQYFLIKNCKGFICCHSGPGAIGSLLDTPMLAVNLFYPYTFVTKKNDIFIFKKIKDKEGEYLNFVKLINNNFYDIYGSSYYRMKKSGYSVVENSEDEILEATKEFLKINDRYEEMNEKQKKFLNDLVNETSYKFLDSRISKYFLEKNKHLF
jgi:putative glycosyltransferase (TIGR04372 family)